MRFRQCIVCRVSLLIAVIFATFDIAFAQSYLTQIGVPPFTTALPVENGFINLANGNLHLQIELGSFPERGKLPFTAGLVYDSRIWNSSIGVWQPTNAGSQGGWRFFTNASPGTVSVFGNRQPCDLRNGTFTIYTFTWTDSMGTQRGFTASTESDPNLCDAGNSPTADGFATDASGFHIYVTNYTQVTAIYAPDGTQVYPSVKDTNGNYFSTDGNGNVIDTLGRTPVTYVANGPGCSANYCYNILNSQGTTSQIKITTTTVNVNTAFGQAGVTEYSGSFTAISSIQLPDGNSYQFTYDSGTTSGRYGLLTGITLPTGGQVTYGYTNFQDSFGSKNRWVNSRTSGGGTWSYTPQVNVACPPATTLCSQQVTVTKPSGDNSVYVHLLNNGAWLDSLAYYNGAVSLSNQVAVLSKTWDFNNGTNVRLLTTQTTLPIPGGSITNQTTLTYNDPWTTNIASIKRWKFYAGTSPTFPTTPDSETDKTYHAVFGNKITNRVTQTTVKDGTGSVVAQTNFSYDDPGGLANSSPATGIQNHDDTNYGLGNTVRGNLTTINRCTNLSSCSSNFVQTLMTYDTTGQLLSVKDPNGNTTSFGYADKFYKDVGDGPANPPQSYSVPTPTNAYLTSVNPPLIPATSNGYFYGTGQQALTTDANGRTAYTHFFDSFNRPTSIVLPNGGWSYTAYTASETQLDTYTGITGPFATSGCTGCRQDETLLDNLGRIATQKLVSDPEGLTTVATNYDTTGRVLSTSHPYRSTSDLTYGLETPTYDGLNRVIKVSRGTSKTWPVIIPLSAPVGA